MILVNISVHCLLQNVQGVGIQLLGLLGSLQGNQLAQVPHLLDEVLLIVHQPEQTYPCHSKDRQDRIQSFPHFPQRTMMTMTMKTMK